MNTNRHNVRTIPMLVLAAGLALPAVAQEKTADKANKQQMQQPENRASQAKQLQSLSFVRATDLIGKDIKNIEDESVGTIDDAIVDRGTGRISHLVIQSGAILGFGGERVAIPYDDFKYDTVDHIFTLPIASEELKQKTTERRDRWIMLNSGDLQAQLHQIGDSQYATTQDAYASSFGKDAKQETIEGTVVGIDRWNEPNGMEYVSVNIIPKGEKSPKTVVLGPSWYIMGSNYAPVQSHHATVRAVPSRSESYKYVAMGYGVNGKDFKIRSAEGHPLWNDDGGALAVFMLSDLVGLEANARSEKGGEIQDALIEGQSGQIGLVVFDPNENFLGIGDDLYPVPWSSIAVGVDLVTIDADAQTFESAKKLPDDLNALTTPQSLRPMYDPFGAKVTTFAERHRGDKSSYQTDSRRGG